MGRDIILRDCAFSPESLGTCIAAVNVPNRSECGAPDYLISERDLPLGYIEAKDIGAAIGKWPVG